MGQLTRHTHALSVACMIALLAIAMLAGLAVLPSAAVHAADEDTSTYHDGTYEGTGVGRNGNIVVSVRIANDTIAEVAVTEQKETEGYWDKAKAILTRFQGISVAEIEAARASVNQVDVVSGATLSSNGVKSAVLTALRNMVSGGAGDEPEEPGEIDPSIFAGGAGTEQNPYLIETKTQLIDFAHSLEKNRVDYEDTHIKLNSDIDISGQNWAPIGGSYYRFNGEFDGNGKTIHGLTEGSENSPRELNAGSAYIGLFGWINEKARIHDLTLDNVAIYTHSAGSAYVGGIAGRASGTDTEGDYHGFNIDGCTVKGVISHTTDAGTSFIGGICGHVFKGTIINTMTDVTMTGKELSGQLAEVGGIAGLLNRGLIANCYTLGDITGSGYRDTQHDIEGMACVGGIAAVNGGYIANCYSQGGVEALEYSIDTGVLTGWVTGIAKVYNCWYNLDARMVIDGRTVSPVDPFGETVAGGVSDEWGFRFDGSLIENVNGYHPVTDAQKVVDGLNASFQTFPIDFQNIYSLSDTALRKWTVSGGRAVLTDTKADATYVQPEVEKSIQEESKKTMQDGTWYGRSADKSVVVAVTVKDGEVTEEKVIAGESTGSEEDTAFADAVARAKFKSVFGDTSNYEPAESSKFQGSGTVTDPYRIENESQLRYLADSINEDVDWQGAYFKQTKDITVTGGDWTPIGWGIFADADDDGFGQDVVALYPFRGGYDGDGHVIRGLRAGTKSAPHSGNYMGLFGIVQGGYTSNEIPADGYRAELKNIHVEDVGFYTENRWRSYIGGLVANAQGGFTIDNCSATGSIHSRSTEDFAFAGGLSGSLMYGSVTDTWTDVDSTAWSGKNYSYAAGMSGVTNRATIVNSYTQGNVHADADQTNRAEAGGFIALDGGVCINCYARGDVEVVSKYSMYMGGFVGMAASASEHRQCYYNTDASQKVAGEPVKEKQYAGKFVNESAEANAQAKSGAEMGSEAFVTLLEENRSNLATTLEQVRKALGADANGSSRYHSVYYNGDGSDLSPWILEDGIAILQKNKEAEKNNGENGNGGSGGNGGAGGGANAGGGGAGGSIPDDSGDVKMIDAVTKQVENLPAVANLGDADAMAAVAAARTAFEALTPDQQALVGEKTRSALEAAELAVSQWQQFQSDSRIAAEQTVKITSAKNAKKAKARKAKKRNVKVVWSPKTNITGYQIRYSTNKGFKKNVKSKLVKKSTTKKLTLKKLKTGKTWYIQIRPYTTVQNAATGQTTKVYGTWSKTKKVRVKR